MKPLFFATTNAAYREVSCIMFGWCLQLTYWYGPPRSVYAGIELHWWRAMRPEEE